MDQIWDGKSQTSSQTRTLFFLIPGRPQPLKDVYMQAPYPKEALNGLFAYSHAIGYKGSAVANGFQRCLPCGGSAPPGDVMESWLDPALPSSSPLRDVAASPVPTRLCPAGRETARPPQGAWRGARLRPLRFGGALPCSFRPSVPVLGEGRSGRSGQI